MKVPATLQFFRSGAVPGALILALTISACDILGPRSPADEMRLELEGSTGQSVLLITSRNFFIDPARVGIDGGVVFLGADTTEVTLPRTERFVLPPQNRLAVRVARPEEGQVTLTMRVFIDGRKEFDVTDTREGSFLQYFYTFN